MNARLIAIAGPLEGQVFPVDNDLSIGRERSNSLPIDDPVLSRRHCTFKREAGGLLLRDLNSMNGTYVNGMPVKERELQDGDQIQIGRSLFAFTAHDAAKPDAVADRVELEPRRLTEANTMMVRIADSPYVQTEKLLEGLPLVWRNARHLEILLKLGAAIPASRSVESLERTLLDLVFQALPAERGAILFRNHGSGELEPHFHLHRGGEATPMMVPEEAMAQVMAEGVAIANNETARSLAAVPLTVFGRTLGVLYLETADRKVAFDDAHLQLLSGMAGLAAAALDHALQVESLERDNQRLQAEINLRHSMVGESAAMRSVYAAIAKVAPASSTVLLYGESGTGKELVARAIHRNGPRTARPFVAVNCAALAETLLESEFFGHEKGAFTGAISQRKGKLEEADTGTVFLDEVGELAPVLQAKLLRVLQEREFQRVGGNRTIQVDIRVLAATNRNLEEAVRTGTFREDLYYRLNVVAIRVPALRDRREDIPLLAHYFTQKHARQANRTVDGVSAAARAALMAHDWPGNVRELENAIERAVVLGSTDAILPEDLPESIVETSIGPEPPVTQFHEAVIQAKRHIVLRAIEHAGGNHAEAARALGLHPSNLHRLVRNLSLKRPAAGAE